jgi:hypothetical protein
MSVLFEACELAKALQTLKNWSRDDMWKFVSAIWVELICYSACQSRGKDHLKMLREGGELMTHTWLLMGHFGISKDYMICKEQNIR